MNIQAVMLGSEMSQEVLLTVSVPGLPRAKSSIRGHYRCHGRARTGIGYGMSCICYAFPGFAQCLF